MIDDRRVHCTIVPVTGPKIEIVRYDRAGKWWYESGATRKRLMFSAAVRFAADTRPAVIWHEGIPGGSTFDNAVRRARDERSTRKERGTDV